MKNISSEKLEAFLKTQLRIYHLSKGGATDYTELAVIEGQIDMAEHTWRTMFETDPPTQKDLIPASS